MIDEITGNGEPYSTGSHSKQKVVTADAKRKECQTQWTWCRSLTTLQTPIAHKRNYGQLQFHNSEEFTEMNRLSGRTVGISSRTYTGYVWKRACQAVKLVLLLQARNNACCHSSSERAALRSAM